jgi:site-specific recombinase XerD
MAEQLSDLAASFRRHLRAEGKSEATCRVYQQALTDYSRWLVGRGQSTTLAQFTRADIVQWLADGAERWAPGTARTRWKGLHRFGSWLVAEGELDGHPMAGLEVPTVPAKPVPVLSDDDLTALVKACRPPKDNSGAKRSPFYYRRDEAVIRLMLDCGIRVAELCGLQVKDVDLDREIGFVTGKGSKTRPVYFSSRTARALDRYLRERRKHRWAHEDALFLGERGPLTTDGARELVRLRAEQAGIGHVNPHRFRHTFAHDFLVSGGQERDLKRLAGWSSDAMLERYGASAADLRAEQGARRLRRGDRV